MPYRITLFLFVIALWGTTSAQSFRHTGCLTDGAGQPVAMATISTVDNAVVATTDSSGCYSMMLADSLVELHFRKAGYSYRERMSIPHRPMELQLSGGSAVGRSLVTKRASKMMDSSPTTYEMAPTSDAMAFKSTVASPPPPPSPAGIAPKGSFAREERADLPTAGQLTAGEINDFSKWALWADITQDELSQYRSEWPLYTDHRYSVQATNQQGRPLADASVELVDRNGKVFWTARTDNTGKAELWANWSEQQKVLPQLYLQFPGQTKNQQPAQLFAEGINFLQNEQACAPLDALDIAFVVDATGSMSDEITYLQSELLNVIERIQDTLGLRNVRLGSVFYRDQQDTYLTKHSPLSGDFNQTIDFIKRQEANGGGDMPEAVTDALTTALDELGWENGPATRLLFLVLDAPPHQQPERLERLQALTKQAARMGVRIIPVACSGINKSTEYLMRTFALATNGTYTFLTDDSGIGNPHLAPTTDAFEVEKLNDVLVRLAVQFGQPSDCDPAIAHNQIDPPQTTDWKFWPNPSRGTVHLEATASQAIVFLTDQHGKILERYYLQEGRQQLQLNRYPAGIYYLRMETESGNTSSERLVLIGT